MRWPWDIPQYDSHLFGGTPLASFALLAHFGLDPQGVGDRQF